MVSSRRLLELLGQKRTRSFDYRHFINIVEPFIQEAIATERYEWLVGFERDGRYCTDAAAYFSDLRTPESREAYLIDRIQKISQVTADHDYTELVAKSRERPTPIVLRGMRSKTTLEVCLSSQQAYVDQFPCHHHRVAYLKRQVVAQEREEEMFERLAERFRSRWQGDDHGPIR